MPSTANGISPIRMRTVIVTQSATDRRTPSQSPATSSSTMVTAAIR